MKKNNIFENIPNNPPKEIFKTILSAQNTRIEKIISQGHTSPEVGWYDQDEHEWVIILKGSGIIEFDNASSQKLVSGDYINIPAHCKHRVVWTKPTEPTIWLAVFYK